ncbi:vascular endothelial growth factor receptor 1 [Nilaparvata lugens]|uniref:vascular endothelial growth factor receptor 1 n=1 Tax=Nilaparvata lugens TaxID=108931 RepID=UPI00193DD937|nr:vascular endothelial growth factor receptor 1 [Nilaparvata lugens]
MLPPKLKWNDILFSLKVAVLLSAILSPDGSFSCQTQSLQVIPLHEDGVITGANAVLACVHSYVPQADTPCEVEWTRPPTIELIRASNDYLLANFTSNPSSSIVTHRNILIIPDLTLNDSFLYTCSVQGEINRTDFHLQVYEPKLPQSEILDPPTSPIVTGEKNFKLVCNATGIPYPDITWHKNGILVTEYCLGSPLSDTAEPCLGQSSKNTSVLTINSVGRKSEGKYNCTAKSTIDRLQHYSYSSTWIITSDGKESPGLRPIEILNDSSILNSTALEHVITEKTDLSSLRFYLTCYIAGPGPINVTWYRGDEVIPSSNWPDVQVIDENELIYTNVSTELNEVRIGCIDADQQLNRPVYRTLKVTKVLEKDNDTSRSSSFMVIWLLVFLGLIIASAFVIMYFMKSKDSDFMEELMEEFHKGRKENLNSDLEMREKAECLPYNREYEFPRSNLKLGKRLGSGAFGLVMFGEANGIVRKGLVTPVAVKMVKNNYEISQIRSLASELKIMQTIGKHLNIVNLLGACTDNLKNLLVIIEYCSYGNLHEFLLQNRNIFVSQVDCVTGIYIKNDIKSTILQEMMTVTYVERDNEVFAKLRKSTMGDDIEENIDNYDDVAPFTEDFCLDKVVDRKSVVSQFGQDSKLLGDDKDMPKSETTAVSNHYEIDLNIPSKVKFDKTADISKICTDDLFCWAYQIARGMEYLASKKIIHGDLAIRNVLLANHNIAKISDFGLSKNVYHYADQNYIKKTKQALPVKWMALESIADRCFSTQSDVWTYGIVLWELFSLAETPYAGMDDFERLFHKLKLGFRMERPANAPKNLYNLMLECWNKEPGERPNFSSLCRIISDMLEKTLRDYYVGLMEYIEENPNKIYDDYYQVMCYKKPSPMSKHTVLDNEEKQKSAVTNNLELIDDEDIAIEITPGYLDMHANS